MSQQPNHASMPVRRQTLDNLRSIINAMVCDNRLGNAEDVVEFVNFIGQADNARWTGVTINFIPDDQ